MTESTTTRVRSPRPVGLFRLVGAVLLAMGAALGSFAFFAGTAGAATGPDLATGSAFGASISGLIPLLPPTPAVTLPASGTATSTTIAVPLNPVLTSATLTATTGATNITLANEEVKSEGRVENANVLITGSTTALIANAIDSTCTSNATGSTGTDQILGLTIGGTVVPVPTTPNAVLTGLGPLAPLISIQANVQTIKNAPGSTSITNDALIITVLGAAAPGEVITLGESKCGATGPDINAVPTVTGVSPNSGPTGGGTSVTITGTGFNCVTGVKFGTATATFTVVNSTTITATSPAGTVGPVDVTVTNCNGTSPANPPADQFTYVAGAGAAAASGGTGAGTGAGGTGAGGAGSTVGGSPTAVHTGEPWAGSIPLAVIVFLLGCALFWRRGLSSTVGRVTHHMASVRRGDGRR